MLQSVPAGGKSTWAKQFVQGKSDWVIVNRDSIREATGEYWVPDRENYISDVEEFQIRSAIKNKLNVIIDATNLNPKTINKWNNLAIELGVELETKEFKISYKEACERDKERGENGGRAVGEKVLRGFFEKYYPNEIKEYYKVEKKMLKQDPDLPYCILVDLDSTIALNQGRSPYDYSKVDEDLVDKRMLKLIKVLINGFDNLDLIFISGREGTRECFEKTHDWILKHFTYLYRLYLRSEKDYRKDYQVKADLYMKYVHEKYNVLCVIDDSPNCIEMYREIGLLSLQC